MASPANSFIRFGQAVLIVYPRDRTKGTNSTMLGRGRQELTSPTFSWFCLDSRLHIQQSQTQASRSGPLFFLTKTDHFTVIRNRFNG